MITSEKCIRLCDNCPNREWEGTSVHDPVTGNLVARKPRYINARLEFVEAPVGTPDVPVQEFGTRFVDEQGNETSAFMPGVQLEDIADCAEPVVSGRSGFMYRKKHLDCGAQALKLSAMRERIVS